MSNERIDREKKVVIILTDQRQEGDSTNTSDTALEAAAKCKSRGSSVTAAHCDAAALSVKNQEKGDRATDCSHFKKGKCAFPENQNDPQDAAVHSSGASAGIGSLYS